MKAIIARIASLGLLFLTAASAMAQAGGWTNRPDAPSYRIRPSVLSLNGKLYMVGGQSAFQSTTANTTLEAYEPACNCWSAKAPVSFGLSAPIYLQAVVANGVIYAIAQSQTGTYAYAIKAYNEGANTWSDVTVSPDYYYYFQNFRPIAIGSKIYIISGKAIHDKYPWTYIDTYDVATGAWGNNVAGSGQVGWNDDAGFALIGGKIYMAGGNYLGYAVTDRLTAFDPATATWTSKANIPTTLAVMGAAALNGKLYLLGGITGFASPLGTTVRVYDPAANSWSTTTSLNTARYGMGATEAFGRIYSVGGTNQQNVTQKTVEEFSLNAGHVRAKSRWLGTYLHLENLTGSVQNGSVPAFWWSSQWNLESSPQGWVRIRNRWSGDYMHIENLTGKVQHGPIQLAWDSAKWYVDTFGNYKRLRNLWNGQFIHIENNNGFAQVGPVNDAWQSAQWTLEPVQ